MLHKSRSTVFISLLDTLTFCQHFHLSSERGKTKRKVSVSSPVFPFPSMSSFSAKWLANVGEVAQIRKNNDRSLVFPWSHCLLSVFEASSVFKASSAWSGFQAVPPKPSSPSCSHHRLTSYLSTWLLWLYTQALSMHDYTRLVLLGKRCVSNWASLRAWPCLSLHVLGTALGMGRQLSATWPRPCSHGTCVL